MKRKKDITLKDESPRWIGVQDANVEELRNSYRKNEQAEQNQKGHSVVDVSGVKIKSNAVKSNTAQEPGMLVHESRHIGRGQTGDGKNEH